jgi:plasmid stabilization system protein ParE
MATSAKTRSVTAHIPEQLAQQVDLMAERLERSKNWIVKQALCAWIDQEEERSRLTVRPWPMLTLAALMELKWTSKTLCDITRLYECLASVNQPAAARTVQQLTAAPTTLLTNPRIGERLEDFELGSLGLREGRKLKDDSTIYWRAFKCFYSAVESQWRDWMACRCGSRAFLILFEFFWIGDPISDVDNVGSHGAS